MEVGTIMPRNPCCVAGMSWPELLQYYKKLGRDSAKNAQQFVRGLIITNPPGRDLEEHTGGAKCKMLSTVTRQIGEVAKSN